ncbi:MarR family winged helix-turn-helix transcriptional regulator [Luethyella okanaganae]|uniref:MarR family winged helix-turn-helix transcriptional regulator n=1 Tax=Luethyella okanaganae TaxID=69372 RepID=A0ABW1VG89_9MICO
MSELDVDALVGTIVDFNRFFIRLPMREKLPFTTLSVIDTLASTGRPMRLSELTKTEQVTQPRLTQLIAQLERDGLVAREPDPRDRRATLIQLTEEGHRITRSRHQDRVDRLRPLVAQLTDEQRKALAGVLPALRHLTELADEPRPGTVDK